MAHQGQEIRNPRTGQTMRFAELTAERLVIETVNPPTGEFEPEHVHPRQDSAAEVRSGALTFEIAGERRVVGAGERIEIPAGAPHRFANLGDADAVALQEFRPALRIADFFASYFALAEAGELDERGMPSLLRLAVEVPRFAEEIRVTSPPWPVQRVTFALLRPVARLRGIR